MLKRMNLVRWFLFLNTLAWIFFWTRAWQKMIPWNFPGKHTPYYLWMRIGRHALPWGSEDLSMIAIILAQFPIALPLRLFFNWQGLYGDFLGINDGAWFMIL